MNEKHCVFPKALSLARIRLGMISDKVLASLAAAYERDMDLTARRTTIEDKFVNSGGVLDAEEVAMALKEPVDFVESVLQELQECSSSNPKTIS